MNLNLFELMKRKYFLKNYFNKYRKDDDLYGLMLKINFLEFHLKKIEFEDFLHNELQNIH